MRAITILGILCLAAAAAVTGPPGLDPARAHTELAGFAEKAGSTGGESPQERLSFTPCEGGEAGPYPCENVDLLAFLPLSEMDCGSSNDVWGWTDPLDGTEYALLGCNNGTAFVDLSDPENPVYLGKLPTHTTSSLWRDIKVYEDHAFVVSEASGHGLQSFDLTELRDVTDPPVIFQETAHLGTFGNSHNVAINEDSGYAYAVGSFSQCNSGLIMVDIQSPANPEFAGCFSADGYSHDVQCVNYQGPDPDHAGDEICFASNEDTLTVVDVTNKSAPVQLARKTYLGSGYTHQGWLTEDQRYFLLDDELDELNQGHNTRTRIWDVQDLSNPFIIGTYDAPVASTDHNQYVKDGYTYQSNYTSGVRILDLTEVASGTLTEAGYFDTYPSNNSPGFNGTWSNYPYFASGIVIASGIDEGLFVLQPTLENIDPSISIADRPEKEGNVGLRLMRFTLTMSSPTDVPVTVDYATADGTAEAGVDYFAASGTVTFDPGETSAGIFVAIIPNTEVDGNRDFFVNLSDPSGATIEDGTAVGVIFDDDNPVPALSVDDAGIEEGDGEAVVLQFAVELFTDADETVSFDYTTVDGTAEAGVDYEATSGTATVPPGETVAVIDVPLIGNVMPENDRTLSLEISNPVNATIFDSSGEGTIIDDDAIHGDEFQPSSGPAAGGEILHMMGENFLPELEIEFGVTPALDIEVLSENELLVTAPQLEPGEIYGVHLFVDDHDHLTPPREQHLHPQHKRYLSDFVDMPRSHAFHLPVETTLRSEVMAGCGSGQFCPDGIVNRGQAAVLLLRGHFGGSYTPPSCSGIFDDVPCPSVEADFIEDLYNRGMVSECDTSGPSYCPEVEVTRQEMAVLILKTMEGPDYQPPACTGLFDDVACPSEYADWIEDLATRNIATTCGPDQFCPLAGVSRDHMAHFLVEAFDIPFLW